MSLERGKYITSELSRGLTLLKRNTELQLYVGLFQKDRSLQLLRMLLITLNRIS